MKNKKTHWNIFCKVFSKKLRKKNKTWNIRCLVDESFVQPSHQAIVIYFRLSDFKSYMNGLFINFFNETQSQDKKMKDYFNFLFSPIFFAHLFMKHKLLFIRMFNGEGEKRIISTEDDKRLHRLRTPNEVLFHWNPKLLGLGR